MPARRWLMASFFAVSCVTVGKGATPAYAVGVSTPTYTPAPSTPAPTATTPLTSTPIPTVAPRSTSTTAPVVTNTPTLTVIPTATPTTPPPATPTFTPLVPTSTTVVLGTPTPTSGATVAPLVTTPTSAPPTATAIDDTPVPTATAVQPTSTPLPGTPTPPPPPAGVVLNELLTNPQLIDWDGTGNRSQAQWLELYNTTDSAISLANWQLATGDGTRSAALPAGQSIGPHGYLVFFKRNIGLDLSRGPVSVLDPTGATLDSVSPPALPADQSYARVPDGSANWVVDASPTLGGANVVLSPSATPDLQATVFAIQTQVAGPLPSPPVPPELDDGSLDATDVGEARQTRPRTSQQYRTLAIADIRNLPDGSPVIASGVITMPTGLWDTARAYIQANGAGILVHGFGATALHLGDTLTIKGRVHHLHGEVEVAAVKNGERVSPGGSLPAPRVISPGSVAAGTEALLVQVSGQVASVERDYATIQEGAGSGRVYLYSRLSLPVGALKVGDSVAATGVVNAAETSSGADSGSRTYAQRVFTASHRLVPRSSGDLVVGGVALGPASVGSDRGAPRGEPAAADRPGSDAVPGSESAQPAAAVLPAATPTLFVTPVLSSRQAAGPALPTPASNVLVLPSGSAGGMPPWMWLCIGFGLALILGGCTVVLAPMLRARKGPSPVQEQPEEEVEAVSAGEE